MEYAVALLAVMALALALAALWHAGERGALLSAQIRSASHSQGAGLVAQLQDLLLY